MKTASIYLCSGIISLLPISVSAQITPDGSTSTTVDTVDGVSTIDAGEQAGSNLFHSFQDFSVPNGNTAFFDNAADIETIFSRVTGGNVSNIDGLIRANDANLFLINPAGVIFGGGARLDIGGAFYGGTADSILFPDDVEFDANDITAPILTINAPIGLSFRNEPADVNLQGSQINLAPGENISLFGGNLNFDNATINALGNSVNLGAVESAGIVSFNENLELDFGNVSLADISLNNSQINVNGAGGGEIKIDAANLTLSEGSIFSAGINSASSNIETQAGDIVINAEETVSLNADSIIRNNITSFGNAGDIVINAQNLLITGGSRLSTISVGNGNTGDINLAIADSIQLNNKAEIKSQISPGGVGNGGDININTESLSLIDGTTELDSSGLSTSSSIFTNTDGRGDAGDINITAGDITIEGSNFQTKVLDDGVGNAGDINITTGSLSLTAGEGNSSSLLANTEAQGNAGNITIEASSDITLEGDSTIQTQVQAGSIGDAGNINITTTNLSLIGESIDSNAAVLANSVGDGNAGNITIDASGNVALNNFGLILSQATAATGDAGDVTINSDSLSLDTGSYIISNTGDALSPENNTTGNAGNITIDSQDITLNNFSQITNNTLSNSSGAAGNISINNNQNLTITTGSNINSLTENNSDGGSIDINSQNIELVTGGKIVTATDSNGNAGNINIDAGDRILIDGENAPIPSEELRFRESILQRWESNTGIFANTTDVSNGDGGNVAIATSEFLLFNGGQIAVDSQGTGNGGNLTIYADLLDLNSQSQLIAATELGQAEQQPSNINLQIENILSLDGDSRISARAFNNANGGNINIDTEFVIAFPAQVDGNDIIASANKGSGGSINIIAQEVFGLQEGAAEPGNATNDLDVTSELGFDGSISINSPDVGTKTGIRDLPVNAIAPGETVQQACSANNINGSSLSFEGRGGILTNPTATMSSDNILSGDQLSQVSRTNHNQNSSLQSATPSSNASPIITAQGKIYPARGVLITAKGDVILTRHANQASKPVNTTPKCLAN